jgi:hypothetical protein
MNVRPGGQRVGFVLVSRAWRLLDGLKHDGDRKPSSADFRMFVEKMKRDADETHSFGKESSRMSKQNPDQIVDHLLSAKKPVSKADLRAVVDLVLAQGGTVVTGYEDDGYCGTRVPGHVVGNLVGQLTAQGLTVKVFPYGIPTIDEAFVQIGPATIGEQG